MHANDRTPLASRRALRPTLQPLRKPPWVSRGEFIRELVRRARIASPGTTKAEIARAAGVKRVTLAVFLSRGIHLSSDKYRRLVRVLNRLIQSAGIARAANAPTRPPASTDLDESELWRAGQTACDAESPDPSCRSEVLPPWDVALICRLVEKCPAQLAPEVGITPEAISRRLRRIATRVDAAGHDGGVLRAMLRCRRGKTVLSKIHGPAFAEVADVLGIEELVKYVTRE